MAKHASLVCQHLENISRQALEKYQHVIRQYVRNRHGVYALYTSPSLAGAAAVKLPTCNRWTFREAASGEQLNRANQHANR